MLANVIILALFGIVMLCLEVVLPGGIVGIIGSLLVLTSVALVFISPELQLYGIGIQVILAAGIITLTVAAFVTWMRYFHKTIIGKRLVLTNTVGEDAHLLRVGPTLAGQAGVAKSDLRPSGTVVVDGKRYEARSVTGFVPAGAAVRVSRSEGTTLLVTPASDSP